MKLKDIVKDTMTADVIYCLEEDYVQEAAQKMKDEQIRRIPVVDGDKKLVGIVALGDLAVDTGREKMSGETLAEISRPSRPER